MTNIWISRRRKEISVTYSACCELELTGRFLLATIAATTEKMGEMFVAGCVILGILYVQLASQRERRTLEICQL